MSHTARQHQKFKHLPCHIFSRVGGLRGQDLIFMGEDGSKFMDHFHRLRGFYALDIFTMTLMGNHFHMVVRQVDKERLDRLLTPAQLQARWRTFYAKALAKKQVVEPNWELTGVLEVWRAKLGNLDYFLRDLKGLFAAAYNHRAKQRGTPRRGHLWADRYGCVMLNGPNALWRTMLYVDANPLKAGLVTRCADWLYGFWPEYKRSGKHLGQEALVKNIYRLAKEEGSPVIATFDDPAAEEKWLKEQLAEEQAALENLERHLAQQREAAEKHTEKQGGERAERSPQKSVHPRRNPFTCALALGSAELLAQLAQSLGLTQPTLQAIPGEDGLFALRSRRC